MSKETLFRASLELRDVTGRTLSGVAVPWDRPTKVRDQTGPPYVEAFSPTSGDLSIRQRGQFPIFVRHDYAADPLGMVRFSPSPAEQALVFETNPLAATARADEILTLVNADAMRSVSVGFRPIHQTRSVIGGAEVDAYRTEVALRELSLAPTGFGQYAEAGITAVRADADEDPYALIAAVDAIIDEAVKCLDPTDDDYNDQQAAALLTGAEVAIDRLLAMFGIPDPDDEDGQARASTRVAGLVTRITEARTAEAATRAAPLAELLERSARLRRVHLPI